MQGVAYPRDVRVGAVADYLLGMSCKAISAKWGTMVQQWVRKAGCFKLRYVERRK